MENNEIINENNNKNYRKNRFYNSKQNGEIKEIKKNEEKVESEKYEIEGKKVKEIKVEKEEEPEIKEENSEQEIKEENEINEEKEDIKDNEKKEEIEYQENQENEDREDNEEIQEKEELEEQEEKNEDIKDNEANKYKKSNILIEENIYNKDNNEEEADYKLKNRLNINEYEEEEKKENKIIKNNEYVIMDNIFNEIEQYNTKKILKGDLAEIYNNLIKTNLDFKDDIFFVNLNHFEKKVGDCDESILPHNFKEYKKEEFFKEYKSSSDLLKKYTDKANRIKNENENEF